MNVLHCWICEYTNVFYKLYLIVFVCLPKSTSNRESPECFINTQYPSNRLYLKFAVFFGDGYWGYELLAFLDFNTVLLCNQIHFRLCVHMKVKCFNSSLYRHSYTQESWSLQQCIIFCCLIQYYLSYCVYTRLLLPLECSVLLFLTISTDNYWFLVCVLWACQTILTADIWSQPFMWVLSSMAQSIIPMAVWG